MAKKIVRDDSHQLEKIAKKLIRKYEDFRAVKRAINKKALRILYLWKLGKIPFYDRRENVFIPAMTKRLSDYTRDVFGYDVSITVHKKTWKEYSKREQKRTMYHELRHIDPQEDNNFKLEKDDDGRLKVELLPHDIVVATFSDEIDEFGLSSDNVSDAKKLAKALKKRNKEKK